MKHFLPSSLSLLALLMVLPQASADGQQKPLGAQATAWIELQQSGSQASEVARPMPGDIAESVYQRYADSFKQPIPAEFKRQSTGSSDNASGQ